MSRLDYVTIAIVAVCVAALVYLIYMTTNLLGGGQEEAQTTTEQPATQPEDAEDDAYYFDEEGTAAEDTALTADEGNYNDDYTSDENLDKGRTSYDDANTSDDSYRDSQESESASTYAPSSYGEYMVIAGTFKVKSNAENMVSKLRSKGYNDATVEIFDRGAYAVALVGQFAEYGDAKDLKSRLSNDGFEALVQKKN